MLKKLPTYARWAIWFFGGYIALCLAIATIPSIILDMTPHAKLAQAKAPMVAELICNEYDMDVELVSAKCKSNKNGKYVYEYAFRKTATGGVVHADYKEAVDLDGTTLDRVVVSVERNLL